MPTLAIPSPNMAAKRVVGFWSGICLTGVSNALGNGGAVARNLQVGVRKSTTEGYLTPPCLALDYPGMWRFRWGVEAGPRSISVYTKQVSNVLGKRPKMVLVANPELSLGVDVTTNAPAGTGWVRIGPADITPLIDGVVWVELWNMDTHTFNSPAFFDYISVT